MPIKINESTQEFHLYNGQLSYIFRVLEKSHSLEHLYYGKVIRHRESFHHLLEREIRPSCNPFEGDHTSSLEHIKQEYPSYGTTDYRFPVHQIESELGSKITDFKYEGHDFISGKPKLKRLPATYVEDEMEAETLLIYLVDEVFHSKLVLSYTII